MRALTKISNLKIIWIAGIVFIATAMLQINVQAYEAWGGFNTVRTIGGYQSLTIGNSLLDLSLNIGQSPSVTTGAVTAAGNTVTVNANLTNMGVASSAYRYVEYWVGNGGAQTTALITQSATGTYSVSITADTNKTVRARAVVQVGSVKSYGSIVTLSTQSNVWGTLLSTLISLILAALVLVVLVNQKQNMIQAFIIALLTFLVIQGFLISTFG